MSAFVSSVGGQSSVWLILGWVVLGYKVDRIQKGKYGPEHGGQNGAMGVGLDNGARLGLGQNWDLTREL